MDRSHDYVVGIPGLIVSVSVACLFLVLHGSVNDITFKVNADFYKSLLQRKKIGDWQNYTVSYVFILLCSFSVISILYNHGREIASDLIQADNFECKVLICMSLGHFIADTIDMYTSNQLTLDMRIHHGVIIVAYSLSVLLDKYQCYLAATLIAETNTVFLHARKLMQLAGTSRNSYIYKSNLVLLFLGFPFQRILPHLWLLSNIYADMERFEHLWMFLVAFLGMATINVLNVDLLLRLIKSETKERNR